MKKFRKSSKKYQFRSPVTGDKLSDRERKTYRKLVLVMFLLIAFSALIYFKGIDFIALYSSFWRSNTEPTPTSTPTSNLLTPKVYSLPTAIKEEQSLEIKGSAPAGTKVVITVNETEIAHLLADASGNFQLTVQTELKEGENKISAFSIDNQENKSRPAPPQTVILDTQAPDLELDYPQEQEIISQDTNVIQVRGKTDSRKNIVTVNSYRAIVDMEGSFSYSLSLSSGENKIEVIAKDEVGHETKEERVVVLEDEGDSK